MCLSPMGWETVPMVFAVVGRPHDDDAKDLGR
jgi:hypothetical protein